MEEKEIFNPTYYKQGGIECIDIMLVTQGIQATKDFCICNAIKYIFRRKNKNGDEDIRKAAWYLSKYLELGNPTTKQEEF
jgi:hypothetical protein